MAFPILAALPLLAKIPSAVKEIASAFGLEKTAKAAEVIDTVTSAVASGSASDEQMQKLDDITANYKTRMAEIALEEKRADYAFEGKLVELSAQNIQVEAKSEDEYVRRTRPWMLRQLVQLVKLETFYLPLAVVACLYAPLGKELMKEIIETLFSMYTATLTLTGSGFLGYSYVRSRYDKPTAQGTPVKGIFQALAERIGK